MTTASLPFQRWGINSSVRNANKKINIPVEIIATFLNMIFSFI
jgi:hypothetical protein